VTDRTRWTRKVADKEKKKNANKKDSQLIIRINRKDRDRFVACCEERDTSAAREIRRFIRGYLDDGKPKN